MWSCHKTDFDQAIISGGVASVNDCRGEYSNICVHTP